MTWTYSNSPILFLAFVESGDSRTVNNGQAIWINVQHITSIQRNSDGGSFINLINGKYHEVTATSDEVIAKLKDVFNKVNGG